MSRISMKRLERLEAAQPDDPSRGKWHQLILDQGENADARMAAMFDSGEAKEGDHFALITIIDPPPREAQRA
jgi:hypothetical protein